LWENGQIVDLNTLLAPGSGLTLYWALYINDRGEIAAFRADSHGNNHDVLLIPCDENHPGVDGCDYSMVEGSVANHSRPETRVELPEVHHGLLQRHNRFHFPAFGPKE
jgi:hypothetical protein